MVECPRPPPVQLLHLIHTLLGKLHRIILQFLYPRLLLPLRLLERLEVLREAIINIIMKKYCNVLLAIYLVEDGDSAHVDAEPELVHVVNVLLPCLKLPPLLLVVCLVCTACYTAPSL